MKKTIFALLMLLAAAIPAQAQQSIKAAQVSATTLLLLPYISGSTQCLHVDSTGHVSGAGADCGAGGGGITALTGDVTASGTGSVAATIANNAVTNAKAAQMAAHTFKGNNTGSTTNSIDLTDTQATAELNAMVGDTGSGVTKGLVPSDSTGGATTKFLRKDGTFAVPAGSGAGNVNGPGSSVTHDCAAFADTSGQLLEDAGAPCGSGGGGGGLPYGNVGGPPDSTTFAWVNQGSSAVVQTAGSGHPIMITIPTDASLNWRGRSLAQPSTPYKLTVYIRSDELQNVSGAASTMGIYFYDSTKMMGIEFLNLAGGGLLWCNQIRVEKMANVTTDTGTSATLPAGGGACSPVSGGGNAFPQGYGGFFLRIKNDGSTLTFSYGFDGDNFIDLYSESVGTFITPTKIMFGGLNLNNGIDAHISTISWLTN